MNIGPIQVVPVVAEGPATDQTARPSASAPDSGGGSTAETSAAQKHSSDNTVPEEVVKVHSDTSMEPPVLVYEFVDSKSGSLILQVPSEQMLNLVQGIRQRLQQMQDSQSKAE